MIASLSLKVYMKWKLSLSYLKELLKWQWNSIYSFPISLFVTLHTSHCIMSCWEIMYMIEIILLNQSKRSLFGVIRQIPLTMRSFVWLCLITSRVFLLLQQLFFNVTYAVCYLHIKQTLISRPRSKIRKNCRKCSVII